MLLHWIFANRLWDAEVKERNGKCISIGKKQQCNLVDIQAAGIQIALSSELYRIENLQGLLM